jgi:hypothetical protein
MPSFRTHSFFSFFIGSVSRRNNRDEIFGVFIREEVWLEERKQSPATQQIYYHHPIALLPRSDTARFLPHVCTTGLHLGSLLSTSCFSTLTLPLLVPPPSDWLRLFSSQTSSRLNTPTISSPLFFLLSPPMKMEQKECSETSAYKIRTPGNYPKEIIQKCPKVLRIFIQTLRAYSE